MKRIILYYLAFLTWIAILLMCLSFILIPIYALLRDNHEWWKSPFTTAYYNSWGVNYANYNLLHL